MLSPREHLVLVGMSHGLTNANIGQHLHASESTIKTHARHIFRKLEATDRAHAVRIGYQWGLLWDHQPREPDPVVGWIAPHIRPRSVTDNGCVGMLLQAIETAAADGHWNGMTEVERWRWSPVVMRAKQVARKLSGGCPSPVTPTDPPTDQSSRGTHGSRVGRRQTSPPDHSPRGAHGARRPN